MSKQKSETKLAAVPKAATTERFSKAEQHREVYSFVAPAGTNPESLLETSFWRHVASNLQPWSRIEVAEETGAWWAEILVQAVISNGLVVTQLRFHELSGVGRTGRLQPDTTGARVEFKGAHLRWCVIAANGSILKDRLPKEHDARQYLESHNLVADGGLDGAA